MKLRKLETLTTILNEFAVSPIPSHIFQVVADFAPALFSHNCLAFCLPEEGTSSFRVHILAGNPPTGELLYSLEEGFCGKVLQGEGTVRTGSIQSGNREPFWDELGLKSALVIPVLQGGDVTGALAFGSVDPDSYNEEDAALAEALGAAVGNSLQNSRLYQELSDERLTLRAVLQASRDAFLLVNPEGILLMANPAAIPLLKVDFDSAPGRPIKEALAGEDAVTLFEERRENAEISFGGQRVAQATLFPVESEFGEILGWAAVFHDVTTLKELNEMKTEFVHTVSHDLKSPIGSLMLGIELVERGENLTEKQKRQLGRMTKTMDDMKLLVENLLDLGRIEADLDRRRSRVELVTIARESIDSLDHNAKTHQIRLQSEDGLPAVLADESQLRQVFNNLIGNAVKYSPQGGKIDVVLASTMPEANPLFANQNLQGGNFVFVSVSDEGIGVSPEDLPRLFDRFFRSEDLSLRSISGTGLGLAIVKKVVEAHDGHIVVKSEPGKGTTFTFCLPSLPCKQ